MQPQSTEETSSALGRLPELLRLLLITASLIVAGAAALAPVVYLLRRLGVG